MAGGNYPAGPPPKEAVDYLRRKGVRAGYDYRDIWREEHAVSFTVANMMKLDMLKDVQASITKALEEGTPADKWKKEMTEEMAKRGWWGRYQPPDPKDPKAVAKANLYMSRRLDTIWRVNTRQAAQAGAWQRGQRSFSHPYVLYRVGPSKKHRDQHLAWDGVLLPKDDPFWAVANPMNGWGCKCYTRFVSRAQHRRYQQWPDVKTESPKLQVKSYENDKTGKTHTGFVGIDQGFERNPGIGRMEQLGKQFRRTDRKLALAWDVQPGKPTKTPPDVKPVADGLDVKLTDPATKRKAEAAIAAIDTFHSDGNLPKIQVIDRAPDEEYFGLFDPRWDDTLKRWTGNIEVADTGPWPELTTAHEIGHLLDFFGLQEYVPGVGPIVDGSYSTDVPDKLVRRLLREIRKTNTYKNIVKARNEAKKEAAGATGQKKERHQKAQKYYDYLLDQREMFARAYAQYVAWRSGDETMLGQIDLALAQSDATMKLRQWPYADYLPLIYRFDMLFEAQGWLTRTKL